MKVANLAKHKVEANDISGIFGRALKVTFLTFLAEHESEGGKFGQAQNVKILKCKAFLADY